MAKVENVEAPEEVDKDSQRMGVQVCWCGSIKFYILKSREIACTECHHYVEGEMVFSFNKDNVH